MFRLGRIQLALFTEFPNYVLLRLLQVAAMLDWYTVINRPSLLEIPTLIMLIVLPPHCHPVPS